MEVGDVHSWGVGDGLEGHAVDPRKGGLEAQESGEAGFSDFLSRFLLSKAKGRDSLQASAWKEIIGEISSLKEKLEPTKAQMPWELSEVVDSEGRVPDFWEAEMGVLPNEQDLLKDKADKPNQRKLQMDFSWDTRNLHPKPSPSKESLPLSPVNPQDEQELLEHLQKDYFSQLSAGSENKGLSNREHKAATSVSDDPASLWTLTSHKQTPQGRTLLVEHAYTKSQVDLPLEAPVVTQDPQGAIRGADSILQHMDIRLKEPLFSSSAQSTSLEQLAQQLDKVDNYRIAQRAHFLLKDQQVTEIRLTLWPENLGKVRVHLDLSGSQLLGKIWVENSQTREVFQNNLSSLQEAFKGVGYQESSFDVYSQHSGEGGKQGYPEELAYISKKVGAVFPEKEEEISGVLLNYSSQWFEGTSRVDLIV